MSVNALLYAKDALSASFYNVLINFRRKCIMIIFIGSLMSCIFWFHFFSVFWFRTKLLRKEGLSGINVSIGWDTQFLIFGYAVHGVIQQRINCHILEECQIGGGKGSLNFFLEKSKICSMSKTSSKLWISLFFRQWKKLFGVKCRTETPPPLPPSPSQNSPLTTNFNTSEKRFSSKLIFDFAHPLSEFKEL